MRPHPECSDTSPEAHAGDPVPDPWDEGSTCCEPGAECDESCGGYARTLRKGAGDGMVGFDAELREAVGRTMTPCTEAGQHFALRCDRPAGHDGVHVQYGRNGADGWGFTLMEPSDG